MLNFVCDNKLARKIIAKIVMKNIKSKLGFNTEISFDQIEILKRDGDNLNFHLNLDITVNEEELMNFLNEKT